jgi:hypothetical protein
VKRYAIISAPNPGQFCRAVQKALEEGWELQGGLSTVIVPVGVIDQKLALVYTQAVVKEELLVKS